MAAQAVSPAPHDSDVFAGAFLLLMGCRQWKGGAVRFARLWTTPTTHRRNRRRHLVFIHFRGPAVHGDRL